MIHYSKETFLEYYRNYTRRIDGRKADQYREIAIKHDVIKTAEGSAIARLGDTLVVAGIKIEYGDLFEDNKGNFIVNIDLSPIAHESFVSGPPDERGIELSRIVDRGFRSAEVLNLGKLALEAKKGYTVFLDMYVIDYDGNAVDASYLAGMAALSNIRIPKIENDRLNRNEFVQDNFLQNHVISSTFAKIDDIIILDPTHMESELADVLVSIAVDRDDNIVGIQKMGNGGLNRDELDEMIEIALKNRPKILNRILGEKDVKDK